MPKTASEEALRYPAPALEKGLDVLELLSKAIEPLHITEIMAMLNRSRGEIHRTLRVLLHRGYVENFTNETTFRLTDRLFSLSISQPRVTGLITASLPSMRDLVRGTGESCYLALYSYGEMVVISRVESGEQVGLSVRVGYHRSIVETASGMVLYAFQEESVRRYWESQLVPPLSSASLASLQRHADRICKRGVEVMASTHTNSVTDLAAPVMRNDVAVAALVIPVLNRLEPTCTIKQIINALTFTCAQISGLLTC